jgi:inositol-phosphate transport system permease protein
MAVAATERIRGQGRGWVTPYLFLSPTLVLVTLFFAIPVVIIVLISLTNMSTATGLRNWEFIGLQNYRRIFSHPHFRANTGATIFYVTATLTLFNVGMALLVALLTTHIPRRAGFFFRGIWLLPRITPVVVYIMMWKFIAERAPFGVINRHLLVPLFGASGAGLVPSAPWTFVIITNGLVGASFGMIVFASAIQSIPRDYMNAALVDGCGVWQRIRYVIVPALKWPLLFVTTYQTLSLLTSFDYILVLTDGNFGTRVWSLWAYQTALSNYFGNFQYGLGSALAVILVALGVVASLAYMRFFRFDELVQVPKIEAL